MMPAFLEPFWAEEVTVDDTYLISDAILRRVDTIRRSPSVPTDDLIDEALS